MIEDFTEVNIESLPGFLFVTTMMVYYTVIILAECYFANTEIEE